MLVDIDKINRNSIFGIDFLFSVLIFYWRTHSACGSSRLPLKGTLFQ